jgi:hypothetical protein
MLHVNSHALTSVNPILLHQPSPNIAEQKLCRCFDTLQLCRMPGSYVRWWLYIALGTWTLDLRAFPVLQWNLNNSSACNIMAAGKIGLCSALEFLHEFSCWLRANTGLDTCVDLRETLSLAIAFSVSTLLVYSREVARARQNLAVWDCPAWASKRWRQMCFPICRL